MRNHSMHGSDGKQSNVAAERSECGGKSQVADCFNRVKCHRRWNHHILFRYEIHTASRVIESLCAFILRVMFMHLAVRHKGAWFTNTKCNLVATSSSVYGSREKKSLPGARPKLQAEYFGRDKCTSRGCSSGLAPSSLKSQWLCIFNEICHLISAAGTAAVWPPLLVRQQRRKI